VQTVTRGRTKHHVWQMCKRGGRSLSNALLLSLWLNVKRIAVVAVCRRGWPLRVATPPAATPARHTSPLAASPRSNFILCYSMTATSGARPSGGQNGGPLEGLTSSVAEANGISFGILQGAVYRVLPRREPTCDTCGRLEIFLFLNGRPLTVAAVLMTGADIHASVPPQRTGHGQASAPQTTCTVDATAHE